MTNERLPLARDDVEYVVVDGQAVVFDPVASCIHHLNETATIVWQCCDGTGSVGALVDDLTATFREDRARVDRDVRTLLTDLEARGLLEGTAPHAERTRPAPRVLDEPPNP